MDPMDLDGDNHNNQPIHGEEGQDGDGGNMDPMDPVGDDHNNQPIHG